MLEHQEDPILYDEATMPQMKVSAKDCLRILEHLIDNPPEKPDQFMKVNSQNMLLYRLATLVTTYAGGELVEQETFKSELNSHETILWNEFVPEDGGAFKALKNKPSFAFEDCAGATKLLLL